MGRVCASLVPPIDGSGFYNSKFGWRSKTWRCQRIQFVRWPVSPSGYLFASVPSLDESIRNTASASASGTLPTSRIGFSLLIAVSVDLRFTTETWRPGTTPVDSAEAERARLARQGYTHGAFASREAARLQSRKSHT